MAFQKMIKPTYPPRHWSIVGHPGSGKSTFAARMRGPKLVIDSDHRFSEVLELSPEDVYSLSEHASDNVDPDAINRLLLENMPGSGVQTVVVDSLTAIITPIVVQAMIDREKGRQKNLMSGFQKKALAMRQLQDAVTRWGTDTLWIYHLQESRDANANSVTRATITQTEIARLSRCINMQLQIVEERSRRGILVLWSRRGRSGMTVWDDSGSWAGMPEKIEEATYSGLTRQEQEELAQQTPRVFRSVKEALTWAVEQGAFHSIDEAREVYDDIKNETQPTNASEMADAWVIEVRTRRSTAPLPEQVAS